MFLEADVLRSNYFTPTQPVRDLVLIFPNLENEFNFLNHIFPKVQIHSHLNIFFSCLFMVIGEIISPLCLSTRNSQSQRRGIKKTMV